jgi:5-methylcytosine-specific restriction endonuclease McrA
MAVIRRFYMGYTHQQLSDVWAKGTVDPNNDPQKYRKDQCGAWIAWSAYGNRDSEYGWEVDHIKPESNGGTDELTNLRPLQWQNNVSKQDGRLTCPVKANGVHNYRP